MDDWGGLTAGPLPAVPSASKISTDRQETRKKTARFSSRRPANLRLARLFKHYRTTKRSMAICPSSSGDEDGRRGRNYLHSRSRRLAAALQATRRLKWIRDRRDVLRRRHAKWLGLRSAKPGGQRLLSANIPPGYQRPSLLFETKGIDEFSRLRQRDMAGLTS